jgi:hypothetical protein
MPYSPNDPLGPGVPPYDGPAIPPSPPQPPPPLRPLPGLPDPTKFDPLRDLLPGGEGIPDILEWKLDDMIVQQARLQFLLFQLFPFLLNLLLALLAALAIDLTLDELERAIWTFATE